MFQINILYGCFCPLCEAWDIELTFLYSPHVTTYSVYSPKWGLKGWCIRRPYSYLCKAERLFPIRSMASSKHGLKEIKTRIKILKKEKC